MELLGLAFTFGFLGSLHCAGMCGPIAFALPLDRSSKTLAFFGALLYNFGRVGSYALIGVLFGAMGWGAAFFNAQGWLSIITGIIILLSVVFSISLSNVGALPGFTMLLGRIKGALRSRFGRVSLVNLAVMGVLNGFLPCGLVYLAAITASNMVSLTHGALYMLFFGLGTFPMMLTMTFAGSGIKAKLGARFQKVIPIALVIIGVLLIVRGLELGIPYLSPQVSVDPSVTECN